jgi:hypothetical protein
VSPVLSRTHCWPGDSILFSNASHLHFGIMCSMRTSKADKPGRLSMARIVRELVFSRYLAHLTRFPKFPISILVIFPILLVGLTTSLETFPNSCGFAVSLFGRLFKRRLSVLIFLTALCADRSPHQPIFQHYLSSPTVLVWGTCTIGSQCCNLMLAMIFCAFRFVLRHIPHYRSGYQRCSAESLFLSWSQ